MNETPLTRGEMRKIFTRHRGEATRLAADIGVHKVTVSQALRGYKVSDRIMSAVRERAAKLLAQEQEGRAA